MGRHLNKEAAVVCSKCKQLTHGNQTDSGNS